MLRLTLCLLGPPLVELDGQAVQLGRHKAVALLAYLALTRQPHARDALATLLWPDLDQSGARGQLRRTLSLLNRALGDEWLAVDRETAAWAPGARAWVDVDHLRKRLDACAAHGHAAQETCPECIPLLAEAVDLYRDGFLAGFTLPDCPGFDEWQFFEGEGLRDQTADALQRLARWHGSREAYETAIPYARRWLALDPLHEAAHRELMALYARSGQRAAALRQYAECERVLGEELGLPPSPETVALHEAIRMGQELPIWDDVAEGAPPPSSAPRRHNLPVQLTPFVGRGRELAELDDLLAPAAEARLVTVLGPGGIGKTRLALEVAAKQLTRYPDGVWFVPLAAVQSAEVIVPTVAQALGVSFFGAEPPRQQLLRYLRDKRTLLVLDNLEHLLEGVDLLVELLRTAPGVRLLVTSRVRLNLTGELVFTLGGMDYPELRAGMPVGDDVRRYSSVALFLRTARRADPKGLGRPLGSVELGHVARICQLAQGMPLAILLAAAWVPALVPAEIAAEMERGLDILSAEWRDEPQRHHSVRAAFDATWGMLAEGERQVFARLSVFRGGFTREGAQAVAGADLRILMSLVNKSLLQREQAGRYNVHELLRQYAADKLYGSPGEGKPVHDRHAAHYLSALQGWAEDLKGPRQQAAMGEIEADLENIRAAWEWAVERRHVTSIAQAMDGLCLYYEWRKRFADGQTACQLAVSALAGSETREDPTWQVRARAVAWQSGFERFLGHTERARGLLERSRELLDTQELARQGVDWEKAFVLLQMGHLAIGSDCGQAKNLFERSLTHYRALADRWWAAQALNHLGIVLEYVGEFSQARRALEEGLTILRSLGDRMGTAACYHALGVVAGSEGKLEEAELMARKSIALLQEIGEGPAVADALLSLGSILTWSGRFAEACSILERAAAMHDEQGNVNYCASALHVLGWVQTSLGLYDQARESIQAAQELFRELDAQAQIGYGFLGMGGIALAQGEFGQARRLSAKSIDLFREAGKTKAVGLALCNLGHAVRGLGQPAQAWEHLREALRIAVETRAFEVALFALSGIALLLADGGQVARAVELYALAAKHPYIDKSQYRADIAGQHIAAVAATFPEDIADVAQERGRARDLWATVEELLAELENV
jgi:predicted ATPase/DNA-binding SARP family transcriptional activator